MAQIAPSTSAHPPATEPAPPAPSYFNRDLSWLEFNRRVLAQAVDPRANAPHPLLERVKFLAIFSSNLDEFFQKRVNLLRERAREPGGPERTTPDGRTIRQTLDEIRRTVLEMQHQQAECWERELRPALAEEGIRVVGYADIDPADRRRLDAWFMTDVFPILTPLAVDPGHRFPFISNLSENLGILLSKPGRQSRLFARVKIPSVLPRMVHLERVLDPAGAARAPSRESPARFIPLDELILNNLDDLFPGLEVRGVLPFRVTRAADGRPAGEGDDQGDASEARQFIDEDDADDLLEAVESQLRARRFASVVRLEVAPDPLRPILDFVVEELQLEDQDVYVRPGPLEYQDLFELVNLPRPDLKHRTYRAVIPPALRDEHGGRARDIFARIRRKDILLHHPYESFDDSTEHFIESAAEDPDVLAIKQTLYRTSRDSPFVASLIKAAESGKQVACLVELRARFDEAKNVEFAKRLEDAGVHVAYGIVGLKTHCKCSLVVRRETEFPDNEPGARGSTVLRTYCHIGTGNYHSHTALLYTDLGLFTCNPAITQDVVHLFNRLTGHSAATPYGQLLVAPQNMRDRFLELIDREMAHARAGRPARIVAKMNAMEDRALTRKLYEASQAGVEITLIVRGFCCLRPGVPGLSDNIRVVSIVGRFLEHSRIFHFGNGSGDPVQGDFFIGSADWMYRNLTDRVEAICPVLDADAKRRLARILEVNLRDHARAWDLNPDGSYTPRLPPDDAEDGTPEKQGSFLTFIDEAQQS